MSNTTMPDMGGVIWFVLTVVTAGFSFLFWRMFKNTMDSVELLTKEIQALRQDIAELKQEREVFHLVYRTKKEANEAWEDLRISLAEIKSEIKNLQNNQAIGVKQLWDKLNRTVDSYFLLAKMIVDRQQNLEFKIHCDNQDALAKSKAETAVLMEKLNAAQQELKS